MFPVPEAIGENKLVDHLARVLSERQSFSVQLQGLDRSSDDYLFLLVQEGKTEIAGLQNEIYTDVLVAYRKTDLPYVPHLTLGVFANNAGEYSEAFAEANRLDLNYRCLLDRVHLLRINDDMTQIVWSREFSFV